MTYLNPLRLHFSGAFQASVSTVNNDPVHFDNQRFKPQYQDRMTGTGPNQWNGWFNPRGDAAWRFLGCQVSGAWVAPATAASPDDPIWTYLVADSDRNVPAKLVDLDPEQQLVSIIWGLQVRITTPAGGTLLRGDFVPAPFSDIWNRSASGGGDTVASAYYQSVLTDLEWGDVSASPFLTQLRAAATDGLLSIKFNVDAFNMDFKSPQFMRGRIVGTIGPAADDEPRHMVLGRHFLPSCPPSSGFPIPNGQIYACAATVDPSANRIYLDLGNALPTTPPANLPTPLGVLVVVCLVVNPDGSQTILPIGQIPEEHYTAAPWYSSTAGVVELPPDRDLTADELDKIARNELAVTTIQAPGTANAGVTESPGGVYVRADQFVFPMGPGDTAEVRLYATKFGQRYPAAPILNVFDPSQLQAQAISPLGPAPTVATPESAVNYPARLVTNDQGIAVLSMSATDPGNPRGYIDGQVYGVRPMLEETIFQLPPYPFNQWDFVTLLVFNGFVPDNPVTWYGCLQPIFQQYENLYPVMGRFVKLGNYDSVCDNLENLIYAFGLPVENPNSMPVTRDLSPAKRAAVLSWLANLGKDGKPLLGTAPSPDAALSPDAATAPAADQPPPAAAVSGPPLVAPTQGGKAAAAARRIGVRRLPAGAPGAGRRS